MKTGNPILELYRNCGMLLRSKDKEIIKTVNKYLNFVSAAGYELIKNSYVSNETKEQLNMELMSVDKYIQYIGK